MNEEEFGYYLVLSIRVPLMFYWDFSHNSECSGLISMLV